MFECYYIFFVVEWFEYYCKVVKELLCVVCVGDVDVFVCLGVVWGELKLVDAQCVIAREYGYESWVVFCCVLDE